MLIFINGQKKKNMWNPIYTDEYKFTQVLWARGLATAESRKDVETLIDKVDDIGFLQS